MDAMDGLVQDWFSRFLRTLPLLDAFEGHLVEKVFQTTLCDLIKLFDCVCHTDVLINWNNMVV